VSYAPKDYTHREISHTLRTRSTPRDLGRDLARDRRCPRRGPRVHVIGTVCAYRMIYHMRGVDRDRACDRDVSIRRYVDRRNDRSTYRSIDRRIDRSQPRLATGRRTFAGARRARAIPRTLRIRNVCRHPSLRASRQDRRRVHRQGHQRQVHDGLEAARQQVRIRRARRSTTTRARVESGGPGARMIIPRAGAGADRVGRERWVTPRARRRIREEYSSHVFVARAFVRARRRARARVVARVGGDLIATDARRAYLFGFSARRRRG